MLITTSNSLRRKHQGRWILNLKNLQQHMADRALNPECLSRRLGTGKNTVGAWFHDGLQPSMSNYLALCEELRVQP